MASIFDKKTTVNATSTKKDEKVVVNITGKEFDEKLTRFNALKKEMANLEAEMATIEGDIKSTGATKFIELYSKTQRNPGSFKLASDSGAKVMVIAMDRYLKIDEQKANELRDNYGDRIVTETVTHAFNNVLLEKYADQISDLIMGADFMSDDEKGELVINTVKVEVVKGAIDEAMTLGKGKIEDYLSDISPVMALKQTN